MKTKTKTKTHKKQPNCLQLDGAIGLCNPNQIRDAL